ncbi:hypothetical protein BHE74_00047895 [Ensete ventricosum]|nr:hypothetical protein BHE74_00047895 [Ensete ventricosum]
MHPCRVKSLTQLFRVGIAHPLGERSTLPENYVRPEDQRPRLAEVVSDAHIPIIDMSAPDKSHVLNHGVPVELMLKMLVVTLEFFRLPPTEKAKLYSDDPAKKVRLSTSSNIRKETIRNWRDYLRLHCYPLEEYVPDAYCKKVRQLGLRLLGAISLSLGLEEDCLVKALGEQGQHMAINYYPKCPQPQLTYGLPAHTDPNALTILLPDPDVAGLQVLKDGRWIAVDPLAHAFVINIGDQLQALTNGKYKSVLHRAVVNPEKERISVASFLCPCNYAIISPPERLISEGSPAMYRSYTYEEYYKKFWTRNLDEDPCLELFQS